MRLPHLTKFLCRLLMVGLLAGLLAACGKNDSKAPNPLAGQQQALQKAQQVEQELQKAEAARREQIERESGAGKPAE
ncbi:MAG: hypothetical protein V4488_17490 [Pseudomonadota bacterium]